MTFSWYRLTKAGGLLDLNLTLPAGQVFCWDLKPELGVWQGVVNQIAYQLKQSDDGSIEFQFACDDPMVTSEHAYRELHAFFQLHVDLEILLKNWEKECCIFEKVISPSKFRNGLRICQQSPFECLISFIVSANNHIKRIGSNLKSIRAKYGKRIEAATSKFQEEFFCFPTIVELSAATEEQFRDLGLGYRAGYIVKTCRMLGSSEKNLDHFRNETDIEIAREFLMSLAGVGRKVADCVCLYSLDFPSVAPVDTHMFQIAQRLFKSVPKDKFMHERIQELMIQRFGHKAGWAHCFLFAADLPSLRKVNSPESALIDTKKIRIRE